MFIFIFVCIQCSYYRAFYTNYATKNALYLASENLGAIVNEFTPHGYKAALSVNLVKMYLGNDYALLFLPMYYYASDRDSVWINFNNLQLYNGDKYILFLTYSDYNTYMNKLRLIKKFNDIVVAEEDIE